MSEQVRRKLKAAMQENARLAAEIERLQLELNRIRCDYVEKSQNEVSATIVQSWNTETGESAYVVSLDDYQKMSDFLNAKYNLQKAEVERLRRAGDNLSRAIRENGCHDNGDFEDQQNAIQAWNAAKEGKPSV